MIKLRITMSVKNVKNILKNILDALLPFKDIKPHERRPRYTSTVKTKFEFFVRLIIAFVWTVICVSAFLSGQYIFGVLSAIVAIAAIGSVNKKTFSSTKISNRSLNQSFLANNPKNTPLREKLLYIASKLILYLVDFKNKVSDLKFINKSTWRANFSLKNNREKYITLILFLLTTASIVTPIALGAEIYLLFAILPFLHLLVRTMHLFLVPEYYSIKNIEGDNKKVTYQSLLFGRIHRDDLEIVNTDTIVKSPVQSKELTLEEKGEIVKRHAAEILRENDAEIDPVTLAAAVAAAMTELEISFQPDSQVDAAAKAILDQAPNYREILKMCLNLIDPNIKIPDDATAIRVILPAGAGAGEVAEEEAKEVEVAEEEAKEAAGEEEVAGEEVTTSLIGKDQLNDMIDQNIIKAKEQAKDGRLIPELAAMGLENKVLGNHDIIEGLSAQSPITRNKKLTSAFLIALLAGAGAGIYFLGANIGPGSEIVALMQSGSILATIGAYAGIIILAFAFLIAAGALIYRINKTTNKPLYAVTFTLLAIVIPPLALGAISIIQAAIFLGISALISAGLLYTARRNTKSFSLKDIIEKTKKHPISLTKINEIHLKTTLRYSLGEYSNDPQVKNNHATPNDVKIAAHFLLAYRDVSSSFPNTATHMVDIIRNAEQLIDEIHDGEAKNLAGVIKNAFSPTQTSLQLKDVLNEIDQGRGSKSIKAYAKKIATNYFLASTPGYIKTSNSKRLAVFVTSTLSTLMLALVFAAKNNTFGLDFTPATINITIAIAAAIFISLLIMYFYKYENISSMAKLTAGLLAGASMIAAAILLAQVAALAQVAVLGALGLLIIGFSSLYYGKDSKDNNIIKSKEGSQISKWFAVLLIISGATVAITLIALQEALPAALALTAIAVAIGTAITGIFIFSRARTKNLEVKNTFSNIQARGAQQRILPPLVSQSDLQQSPSSLHSDNQKRRRLSLLSLSSSSLDIEASQQQRGRSSTAEVEAKLAIHDQICSRSSNGR